MHISFEMQGGLRLRECKLCSLHWTRGSVLELASRHEARVGGCARMHTAVDTAAGFCCGLVTMRYKYGLYFVVPHRVCPSPKSLGAQTEYHYLRRGSYSNI